MDASTSKPVPRRALLAGLALSAAAPASAWAQPAQPAQPTQPTPPAAEPSDVISGEKDWTTRLTTPVKINGAGPFHFIIDTGANRSVISDQVARQLDLPAGEPTVVHGIAGVLPARTVNVRSFMAGGVPIPIRDVPVLDGVDLGAQGLLGIDAFHNRKVTFDFVRGLVRISRPSVPDTAAPNSFSLIAETTIRAQQRSGQLTIIDAQAVDRRITCFIDSGAQESVGNLAMLRMVLARGGSSGFTPVPIVLHGATGQDAKGQVAIVPTMRIGHLHFTAFAMPFADLHTFDLWKLADRPAMMVGMDLLSRFATVIVDFGQRQVTFKMATSLARQLA